MVQLGSKLQVRIEGKGVGQDTGMDVVAWVAPCARLVNADLHGLDIMAASAVALLGET